MYQLFVNWMISRLRHSTMTLVSGSGFNRK